MRNLTVSIAASDRMAYSSELVPDVSSRGTASSAASARHWITASDVGGRSTSSSPSNSSLQSKRRHLCQQKALNILTH